MAQRLQSKDELFKGRHFEREIIVLCVRWYCASSWQRAITSLTSASGSFFLWARSSSTFIAASKSSVMQKFTAGEDFSFFAQKAPGLCHVGDDGLQSWQRSDGSEGGGRILGAACEQAPCFELRGQLFAIERCAQQMALEGEVLAGGTEAREKRLRALRPAKSSHAPLLLTGGLTAVLGTVVHARTGLHEHVPDGRKLRDLGFRGCAFCTRPVAATGST